MIMREIILGLLLVTAVGCSSVPVYKEIQKSNGQDNVREFTTSSAELQKALVKVLLSKQFTITNEDDVAGTVTASRSFSQSSDIIVITLSCRMFLNNGNKQQLFLNGVQSNQRNYIRDHTRFFLGVVPMMGGGGKDVTKTKAYEAAIVDKSFYDDIFDAIRKNLSAQGRLQNGPEK